ncbi:ArfGAP with dual PH domains [Seminavis robusta]|uniref:ArfGAP with dual PH domains n=1 Tax=Seminavis robusta TaxID=568900 RepID=A0A9N8DPT9_9STRA|nr:ArfGAP with dual PH domains [Seminavis robusta]|eukprot:Sro252_g099630.1 ArfGAP with dual PH domains (949) ;mRNA; r:36902-39836
MVTSLPGVLTKVTNPFGQSSKEVLQKRLMSAQERPENQVCSDCDEPDPEMACLLINPVDKGGAKLGVFCCEDCASAMTDLGRLVCEVKSTTLTQSEWTPEDVLAMENTGNELVSYIFEAQLSHDEREEERYKRGFHRHKYEILKFFSKAAYEERSTQIHRPAIEAKDEEKVKDVSDEKKKEKRDKKKDKDKTTTKSKKSAKKSKKKGKKTDDKETGKKTDSTADDDDASIVSIQDLLSGDEEQGPNKDERVNDGETSLSILNIQDGGEGEVTKSGGAKPEAVQSPHRRSVRRRRSARGLDQLEGGGTSSGNKDEPVRRRGSTRRLDKPDNTGDPLRSQSAHAPMRRRRSARGLEGDPLAGGSAHGPTRRKPRDPLSSHSAHVPRPRRKKDDKNAEKLASSTNEIVWNPLEALPSHESFNEKRDITQLAQISLTQLGFEDWDPHMSHASFASSNAADNATADEGAEKGDEANVVTDKDINGSPQASGCDSPTPQRGIRKSISSSASSTSKQRSLTPIRKQRSLTPLRKQRSKSPGPDGLKPTPTAVFPIRDLGDADDVERFQASFSSTRDARRNDRRARGEAKPSRQRSSSRQKLSQSLHALPSHALPSVQGNSVCSDAPSRQKKARSPRRDKDANRSVSGAKRRSSSSRRIGKSMGGLESENMTPQDADGQASNQKSSCSEDVIDSAQEFVYPDEIDEGSYTEHEQKPRRKLAAKRTVSGERNRAVPARSKSASTLLGRERRGPPGRSGSSTGLRDAKEPKESDVSNKARQPRDRDRRERRSAAQNRERVRAMMHRSLVDFADQVPDPGELEVDDEPEESKRSNSDSDSDGDSDSSESERSSFSAIDIIKKKTTGLVKKTAEQTTGLVKKTAGQTTGLMIKTAEQTTGLVKKTAGQTTGLVKKTTTGLIDTIRREREKRAHDAADGDNPMEDEGDSDKRTSLVTAGAG